MRQMVRDNMAQHAASTRIAQDTKNWNEWFGSRFRCGYKDTRRRCLWRIGSLEFSGILDVNMDERMSACNIGVRGVSRRTEGTMRVLTSWSCSSAVMFLKICGKRYSPAISFSMNCKERAVTGVKS